jgi:hypothetical protein
MPPPHSLDIGRSDVHQLHPRLVMIWRAGGGVPAMLAELVRRARARPGGGVHVRVEIVHTLDEAAELIDQLGRRLLAGETIVALCDEIDADLIHRHAEIYATMPAH